MAIGDHPITYPLGDLHHILAFLLSLLPLEHLQLDHHHMGLSQRPLFSTQLMILFRFVFELLIFSTCGIFLLRYQRLSWNVVI